jgi:adenosylmethionine-8-amino-7-oxononanoate aminotransferase
MESVVGAGGCLVIRALCDEYGILLHVDEFMVGFGPTGKMFGFQNYEGRVRWLPAMVSCNLWHSHPHVDDCL